MKQASLSLFFLWLTPFFGIAQGKSDLWIMDHYGAVVRGDLAHKEIALVFTGDAFAEGGEIIRTTLKKNHVQVSFFLTGNFYRDPGNKSLIEALITDGHYMGAHSDKHLLYADWQNRDSLLVSEEDFRHDLHNNYKHMAHFGIRKADALYFIPPYEWYNRKIAEWTSDMGLHLISFSPGTLSHADYTYPEMGERYKSSEEIYKSIMHHEATDVHGLKGFILLFHIGTDPRRADKFYNQLERLILELDRRGYSFVEINELLN